MGILGELWVKLGLKNDNLKKGLKDSEKEVSTFAAGMKKLGGMIGAAFSIGAIVKFTHQTAELANKAKGVKKAFDALNNPALLGQLRRATRGTVDDLQLMQKAVQADRFKIPMDQLASYFEFATQRATDMGVSVDYLVDSIITGLGRNSIQILDNLGFSAAEIRDKMKDGGTMAEAVGKIIQEQMGDAKTQIDEAALSTEKLATAWTNLQTTIGSGTSGVWNTIKGWAAGQLEEINSVLNSNNLNGWQKFFSLTPIMGYVMRKAGTLDRAFEKDAQEQALKEQEAAVIAAAEAEKKAAEAAKIKAAEEAKFRSQIIARLEDEIENKTQLRDLSANTEEIDKLNDEIKALEEKLKLLKMTKAERVEYYKSQQVQIEKVDGIFDLDLMQDNLASGKTMLDNAVAAWQQKGKEMAEISLQQQQLVADAAAMITQSLVNGIGGSLNELASVIAGVEGANVGSVVSALLSPLADACISAGLLIMTTGEGIEALKLGLQNFIGAAPMAAGAALMAIGTAAKAGLAAIGKKSGNSGATAVNNAVNSYTGGYGVSNSHYNQNNQLALTTTLKGQDLLLSIERTQQNNRR